jgi:hypothetical protein
MPPLRKSRQCDTRVNDRAPGGAVAFDKTSQTLEQRRRTLPAAPRPGRCASTRYQAQVTHRRWKKANPQNRLASGAVPGYLFESSHPSHGVRSRAGPFRRWTPAKRPGCGGFSVGLFGSYRPTGDFAVDGRPDLAMVIYNPATPADADRIRSLIKSHKSTPTR